MTASKLKVCSILWRSEVPLLFKLSSKRPRIVCESVSNSLLFSLSLPSKNKDIWEELQAWSNSWDTNAITRQNDAFSLLPPPGAVQTLCREAIFFNTINIDWGERDSRNRLLQQHSRAFIRSRRRVPRCFHQGCSYSLSHRNLQKYQGQATYGMLYFVDAPQHSR